MKQYKNLSQAERIQQAIEDDLRLEAIGEKSYWREHSVQSFEGEEWRIIPNFSNYEASSLGRIKSNRSVKGSLIMSQFMTSSGYLQTPLRNDEGKKFSKSCHRLVASAFFENFSPSLQVHHIKPIPTWNAVNNLKLTTAKENMFYAYEDGLMKIRFSKQEVIDIFQSSEKSTILAKKYNVKKGHIYDIKRGRIWKHVTAGLINPTKGIMFGHKINSEIVEEIRQLSSNGYSNIELSKKFNLNVSHIWRIITYRCWS